MNFDGNLDFSVLSSDVTVYDDTTPEQLLERIEGAGIIVTKEMPVSGDLIRKFPASVKLICEAGTGYNNLDLDAAREMGITVCNIPAYSSERVAHTAIMMILNLSSTMQVQMKMLANGNHDNFTKNLQVPHVEVNGKTLGIIGAGHIGKTVMKIAKALDMARKSIVLLKNKNNMLPLDKNIKKIAVVGPNAADSTMLWANYNGFPTKTVTIVEGIRNKVPNAEVIYELGCNHTADFVVTDLGSHVSSTAGQGFASEFFNNTEFEGTPAYKGLAKELHYTTGGNTQFAPNVNLTNFTARFTGEFESPIDGPVEFKLSGNDAFRLYIDTAKVAEVLENEYGAEKLYTLNAKKGEKYPIKIEYMQRTGSADLNFTVGVRTPVDFQATASKVKDADVIVFVGGISPRLEGEEMPVDAEGFRKGDRTNIEIPAVQKEMVKALVATGKPVVYVVCTGSALALNWENDHVNAILNAWYGGQEGGTAVADVLFGDYNPAGRLPITFYKSVDQLPDFQDYSMKGRTYRYMTQTPLYPFGYGLSYTTFDYKNAKLSKDKIASNESVTLSFDIANTGKMDGDEVAQIYIKNPNDPAGPLKAMKAFKRVNVKAGSEQPVSIQLEPKAFQSFNDNTQTMEIRPGKYQILYGGSSDDKTLKKIDLVIE